MEMLSILIFILYFFLLFETGFHYEAVAAWNTQRSALLCLLSPGIKGMYHHVQ